MIISHKHKFIFIKTKKTAGTSIEIALSAICGDEDIITPINSEDEIIRKEISNRNAQNYSIPFSKYSIKDGLRVIKKRNRLSYYNHMTASVLMNYIDPNIWNTYYKFCFDRNPISKCISHYYWRGKKVKYSSFSEYLKSDDVLMLKGDYFYKDNIGNTLVDKVYKMEEMDIAFTEIANKLGLNNGELKIPYYIAKKTSDKHLFNKEDLSIEDNQRVREIFATEFKELYNND